MTTTPLGPPAPEGPPGPPDAPPGAPESSGPRVTREEAKDLGRIRRSTGDRKIAGVAGGVARHFDIDPLLVRVGLVLLAVFGGGGLLIYAAGWLLIPEEGSDEGVIGVDHRTRTVLLAVVGGIAALSLLGDSLGGWEFPWYLAALGLLIAVAVAPSKPKRHPGPLPATGATGVTGPTYRGYEPPRPRPVDPRRRGPVLFGFTMALAAVGVGLVATLDLAGWDAPVSAYPAAVLAACGVMLLVGAFYGRAGGLVLVGLVAAVATLVAAAAQDLTAGQVVARPSSAADLDDEYSLGAGEIVIDLTRVDDLASLDGRRIEAEVRFGRILVQVPEDGIDVRVTSTIEGGGESVLFGDRRDGSLDDVRDVAGGDVLELDLTVLFGQVEVETKEVA